MEVIVLDEETSVYKFVVLLKRWKILWELTNATTVSQKVAFKWKMSDADLIY